MAGIYALLPQWQWLPQRSNTQNVRKSSKHQLCLQMIWIPYPLERLWGVPELIRFMEASLWIRHGFGPLRHGHRTSWHLEVSKHSGASMDRMWIALVPLESAIDMKATIQANSVFAVFSWMPGPMFPNRTLHCSETISVIHFTCQSFLRFLICCIASDCS